jgi:hypothetical protein
MYTKVSLHESGRWSLSFVESEFEQQKRLFGYRTRHMELWDRPAELLPGIYHGLKICIPQEALRTEEVTCRKGVHWFQLLPGFGLTFTVIFTTHESLGDPWLRIAPGNPRSYELLLSRRLKNGHVVWLHLHRLSNQLFVPLAQRGLQTFGNVLEQARRFGLTRAIGHIRAHSDPQGAFTLFELPVP